MNSNTARLIAEDLSMASDMAFDCEKSQFAKILSSSSDAMYELSHELAKKEEVISTKWLELAWKAGFATAASEDWEGVVTQDVDSPAAKEDMERDIEALKAKLSEEKDTGKMVLVPLDLLKRLADDDWGKQVPDNYRPFLAAPDGSGSPSSFTVGDLREAARIVNEVEK